MTAQITHTSLAEFEAFIQKNADRRFEYIAGEIVEVVSNNYASKIAARIVYLIMAFLEANAVRGDLTTTDGGYMVNGHRYMPDVAFISRQRQPEPNHDAWNPLAPDLAVEVVSPTDQERTLSIKIVNYLRAGTTVWVVYPDAEQVVVYAPDADPHTLDNTGTLSGSDVLPGFTLPTARIFQAD